MMPVVEVGGGALGIAGGKSGTFVWRRRLRGMYSLSAQPWSVPAALGQPIHAILLTLLMTGWCILGSMAFTTEAADAVAENAGADPLTAATERHAWRWFGLTLAAAEAQAAGGGQIVVVIQRDGNNVTPEWTRAVHEIGVVVHGDRIIEAQIGTEGDWEGTRDVSLLPWLGHIEEAAAALAQVHGRPLRVVARDSEHYPVTMDYRENRLNVHLQQGVVITVHGG